MPELLPFKLTDDPKIPLSEGAKGYKYGELLIIQTIDPCPNIETVIANFGTHRLPTGNYKHTSISHPKRYPTWEEIKQIKELLHGDVFVFQALPPKSFYTNVHPNCFHLWEITELKY